MSDLIDRSELLKALNKVSMEHHETGVPMVEHEFRELIHSATPAHQEISAHWCDMHGNRTKALYSVYCSACGGWAQYAAQFCPKCGAKMEGEYE